MTMLGHDEARTGVGEILVNWGVRECDRMSMLMSRVVALSQRLRRPVRFCPDAARDIFPVAYPRSGTTWISCVAAELLFQTSPKSLPEIGGFVPDVHDLPEKLAVPAASHYLVKSHFPLNAVHGYPSYGDYRRVIYLLRDPRDVMLSYHRYNRHLSNYLGDLKEFAMDWVAGRIWPCSWNEHVNSWLAPRLQPAPFELTVLRYEDFIADPIGQIGTLAKVLGVDVGRARIEEIIADTSPDSMREREARGKNGNTPEFNFIGPAKAGGWTELQSRDDLDAIYILEEFARDAMQRSGYQGSAKAKDQLSAAE
ncbi:MAG TPA: sulfotransferase domain-containing protein [Methylocella sp.]|nr:sulfotransferase domain-containing protein [Methylocella sp.]